MNELIMPVSLEEELLAQRYYTEDGQPDYVSVEEIHRILQRNNGKEILQDRFSFLLPMAVWAGEAYGAQNQKRLFDWLEERARYRLDLRFAFNEAVCSDRIHALLQDQIGFGVDFQDIEGPTRIHPAYTKKFFSWMQQAQDFDLVLLIERDNSKVFGKLYQEFSKWGRLVEQKKAASFPENMPKVVAVYWGDREDESVLFKRLNQLRTVLPGIMTDPATQLAYVEKDLYLFPRLEGPEGHKRFVKIFGGKPSLLPIVSPLGERRPYVLSDQSCPDKGLPSPAGQGLHLRLI